jgi:lipopolysaccharide export system protein LptA
MNARLRAWLGAFALAAALLPALGPSGQAQPAANPAQPGKKKTAAILPGGDSNKPINIQAVKLDYFDKERKLVYTGNVIAVQGDSILKASILTIFLTPKKAGDTQTSGSSTGQVQRMLATGPVTLLQRDQIGTGDNGVYDKLQDTVILTGNVTLSQGGNVTKGDRLVYNLKSGQAVVTNNAASGPVKSMFVPDDSSNSTPAAAPEPAKPKPTRRAKKTKRSTS